MLKDKQIVVVVTGGIAAYKIPLLVRGLIKRGARVRVAMTSTATKFVTRETLEVLTHYPVLTETSSTYPDDVPHIALADWADYALIAPATANTIGKLANGIADNEALSALLAMDVPTLVIPAMNQHMWAHPAVMRNVQTLRHDGYYVLEPAVGYLAEGYEGKGRMIDVESIQYAMEALIANTESEVPSLAGEKIAISLGGTEEVIDPVRYLTNRSSGKMGLALAYTAVLAGAEVTIMPTPVAQTLPMLSEFHVEPVSDARSLERAMLQANQESSIVVMAAAVSDYRAQQVSSQKIKKQTQQEQALTLALAENPDILAELDNQTTYLVGFAAETQDVENYARQKLQRKGADMIVANDVSDQTIGFGSRDNAVKIITKTTATAVPKQSKLGIAAQIWRAVQADKKHK
ncbi:MAG: bifunctional phosphopantothenoylcysteine decarboxylase/phosphopantothenate--cysteine ligase CoaBC [Aerococcus sp.]|nr:bifunctional phosphopantothenoylcysteine decarboxylase/phosphopantothenate--cysteine ligase CoaBC [Aerococcus sp.]